MRYRETELTAPGESQSRLAAALRQTAAVGLGVGLVAVAARVALRVPISPVPVTLQTMAVLLVGGLYGSRLGPATVAAYVVAGLAGAPVFASGVAGPAVLLGPTAGYLLGFAGAAYLVGAAFEANWGGAPLRLGAVVAASALILAFGAAWLKVFLGCDWVRAFALGFLPFVAADAAKAALAVALCGMLRGPAQRAIAGRGTDGHHDANP